MKCEKCGSELTPSNPICPNCGHENTEEVPTPIANPEYNSNASSVINTQVPIENHSNELSSNDHQKNLNLKNILNFIQRKKSIFIIVGIVLIIILCLLIFGKKNRAEMISNIEIDNKTKFTLNGNEFHLGEKLSSLTEKELYFSSNQKDTFLVNDSIALESFYYKNKSAFIGAIYCGESNKCTYENSVLLKANFYEKNEVVIDDFIKVGTKYDDIVEKYGSETGTFYQDKDILVWSFGKKIGDPYYLLKFDRSSVLPTNKVSEIRIGIWWYDGEYEHTIIKEEESDNDAK